MIPMISFSFSTARSRQTAITSWPMERPESFVSITPSVFSTRMEYVFA